MKKVLSLFIVFLNLSVFASLEIPRDIYMVNIKNEKDSFVINVTKPQQSSIANLIISDINITLPEINEDTGTFSITVMQEPNSYCLPAIGAHKGSFRFNKGKPFPSIPYGAYRFVLNGADRGILEVSDIDAVLAR